MAIKQLTVFVENKQGSVVSITDTLSKKNINLRALSIAETQDFGILRLIVNDEATAEKILKEEGYLIKELVKIVDKYNAYDSVYFAASSKELEWMKRVAPQIKRVAIQLPDDETEIYETARKYECSGVQFWLGMFDEELINKFH